MCAVDGWYDKVPFRRAMSAWSWLPPPGSVPMTPPYPNRPCEPRADERERRGLGDRVHGLRAALWVDDEPAPGVLAQKPSIADRVVAGLEPTVGEPEEHEEPRELVPPRPPRQVDDLAAPEPIILGGGGGGLGRGLVEIVYKRRAGISPCRGEV